MKKFILMLPLIASVMFWNGAVLAGEHGGSEHGGTKVEGSHGHMKEGSHGMAEHIGTLKEAAKVLKKEGYPELAAELEEMAKMKEKM